MSDGEDKNMMRCNDCGSFFNMSQLDQVIRHEHRCGLCSGNCKENGCTCICHYKKKGIVKTEKGGV